MTASTTTQLTFNFEPSLPERFKTLRAYVSFRVQEQRLNANTLAAKMDLSPSVLSRKLNPAEGDSHRLNVDDLEAYVQATGDVSSVIEYLAAKYMDNDDARKARTISRVEQMLVDLQGALSTLKQQDTTYAPLRAAA